MRYVKDNTKTIGVIVEDIFTDFSKEIIHSVAHATIDMKDINLVVLQGRQDESKDPTDRQHMYKSVYNTIYSLEQICKFDGLILTIPNKERVDRLHYPDIPKVYVAVEYEGETTVNYNDEMGICEALDYLVKVKGFNRLCMLGGRDDNCDAQKRKRIFFQYLVDNGLEAQDKQYERTDMSVRTEKACERLLDNNPDVQAIFCVNDQSANGLYEVMKRRELVPGRDITVFGFDNTYTSGNMVPPLASIGADSATLGQRAVDLLLDKMKGKEVESVVIPTRLFGRESLNYEMYEYNSRELIGIENSFIYRMFDECFYRYRNEIIDKGDINLKRLFFEFISRILICIRNRYMGERQFEEIGKLIDRFFENGAMEYTDANTFVRCVERFQGAINKAQESVYVNLRVNRLFSRMRDKAILALASNRNLERRGYNRGRNNIFEFQVVTGGYDITRNEVVPVEADRFSLLGFKDAALYLFEKDVEYNDGEEFKFPEYINLKCVVRNFEQYVLPQDRQESLTENIFKRDEIRDVGMGLTVFPLFYGSHIYGLLVCSMNREILDKGEYISAQLSRAIHLNRYSLLR